MSDETSVTTEKQLPAGSPKDTGAESEVATASSQQQTEQAKEKSGADESDQFYDPTTLPAELQPIYKQMQRGLTKKTQALAAERTKVKAYDEFMRDPMGAVQRLAQQHGYQVTKGGENKADPNWQPSNWNDVIEKAKAEAKAEAKREILEELRPFTGEIMRTKQSHIESVLDKEVPEWRQYEDEMIQAVNSHPTLANDPVALARIAIPQEILEGKAMQAALKRMEKKGASAKVSAGSSTSKTFNGNGPSKKRSFNEAVEFAKAQLATRGLRPS